MMNNALATMLLNESDEALEKRKHTHTHTHIQTQKSEKWFNRFVYIRLYGWALSPYRTQHKTDSNSEKIETQFPFWMLEYRLYP